MTAKSIDRKKIEEIIQCESNQLLQDLNQKVDYIIEILREEELRYPHHQLYNDIITSNQNRYN